MDDRPFRQYGNERAHRAAGRRMYKCGGMQRWDEKHCAGTQMLDWDAVSAGRNNYTSAEDLLRVFRALYAETVLTPELCALARSILRRQRDTRMLTRYIWQDVPCAHKTGGLDRLSHDAGVFELPGRPYFIAVLIWDAPDIDGDEPLAGRVSKLVFDYYSQEDTQ